jgi:serine/threonine-protein kinase
MRLGGRYRLDQLIANGGMAQVWAATDETLQRRVAVKILHDHLRDPATVARFRAEGVATARLRHPGIVAIYDTCTDGDIDAIVMEFVDGRTLRDELDEKGRLDAGTTVAVGIELADALHAAHQLGLVHRDVKPGNVLVCPDGRAKLTDFGIAKLTSTPAGDLTVPGSFIGTAKYLAPEQVEGDPVDARTDVYSLGIMLYEMLTGRVPFEGPNDAAIALARIHQRARPIREQRADVPGDLAAVVDRALAREPSARWSSMHALRIALAGTDLQTAAVDATNVFARPARDAPRDTPGFATTERRWLIPAVFVVIVGVSLAVAGVLIGRSETGGEIVRRAREVVGAEAASTTAGTSVTASDVTGGATMVSARAFDPEGDNDEHDDEVANVIDDDGATRWTSERYFARTFGTKRGVGLVIELSESTRLQGVDVHTTNVGWAGAVYVADQQWATLDGWGQPAATGQALQGDARFDVGSARGKYVLVWFTDLGEGTRPRAEVSAVIVTAAR